ncbi:MAG TPA: efflux RND transporter periplasmic adaptor subunit [Anaerolineales bacterium]|nr:efflux RND transporter periplasmic adaptor subunit [Anaerolineales bacterium]
MRQFLKKNRTIIIVLLVIAIVTSAFIFVRRSSVQTTTQFQTAKIERGTLTATIGATGTVRAKQTATLAWQAAGSVDTVNVKVGDNIPADFVMAFLAKTSLPQNVIMAEADLASAQKDLDQLMSSDTSRAQALIDVRAAQEAFDKALAWRHQLNGKIHIKKIIYKRLGPVTIPVLKEYRGYADKDTVAKADEDLALAKAKLDDARREYDRLNNGNMQDIVAAQARVDAAQATINLARLKSPFAGTVTESHPLPGDQVNAGDVAFRLDDLSSLLVDVQVSEVDINNISVDQQATLSFDAILGKTYHGQVVEVAQAGTADQGVVNFTVTVELTDADASVKPGMTAAVNIVVQEMKDVLLVQNRAVRLVDSDRVVYVLENGQPVKKTVRLGSSSDSMSVVTGGDVKEGDTVVLNPPAEFTPGGPRRFGG